MEKKIEVNKFKDHKGEITLSDLEAIMQSL